jgi:uncharacterized tellurite resistance protein B-like protein|tara:strand:+ start:491 stop:895 length:405 start_codon:yes stop_codon:yes gene_type:complete
MNIQQIDEKKLIGIIALLIHAAKIDDCYTQKEKKLITDFAKSISEDDDYIKSAFIKAEAIEANSNQLLDFTKIIKDNSLEFKTIIVKELWKLIISDNSIDDYESNLIRRICGLIYFPDKLSGEIKLKLIQEIKK